ncbi:Retinol dehydrogenase 5 [Mactra antiquata]
MNNVVKYLSSSLVIYLTVRWLLRKLRVGSYGNKYVFITGCDSGFGNLLTKRLDGLGFHVFAGCLTEKGSQSLKTTCSSRVTTVVLDVTDENSIRNTREQIESKLPENKGLWAIVNNAGIAGTTGPFEWQTTNDLRHTLDVNLFGVMFVAKEFLPLVRRERGRVINTASMMGRFAGANVDYTASKYGVEGFSDRLRREQYHTGVTVHIIEPGFFQTELFNINDIKQKMKSTYQTAPDEVQQYYGESYPDKVSETLDKYLQRIVSMDTYKVVDAYVHAITAKYPKARYVVGRDANIFFRLLWNLPEWLSDYIVCRGQIVPAGAK